jgi:transposase
MALVVIGMDPHKRSATIEVLDAREKVLATGRFGTDCDGYKQLLAAGRGWPDRVWAVEGCEGVGRHIAQRLVADGEPVVDVPAKLSAQARVFSTGQGRKTDPTDAHSVALVALRTPRLRPVQVDGATVALRLLVDRRDELGAARTVTVNRLHRLLVELIPGGAKTFLSATQAKALLATVRPRDLVGKTRRKLAAELVSELVSIDKRIKSANTELRELVEATGSTLLELNGIGPSPARRHRRRGQVPDPRTLRVLERHRPHRRLLRGTEPPPALAPGTGGSTGCCTSWRSCSCATTPKTGLTTGASSPPARPPWKRSAPSNGGSPTSSTTSSWPTRNANAR